MLANSSAHGLPHLVSDKPLLAKVIWTIAILASFIGGLIFIFSSILEYYHYDIVTSIRIRDAPSLEYPAVTFCAYNSVNSSIKENLNLTMIKECRFSAKLCDMTYFKEIQILQAGQYQACLQFNSKQIDSDLEILNVTKAGFSQSLAIDFDLSPDLLVYFSIENNDHLALYNNFGSQLEIGKTNYKSIEKIVTKTLGKPFNDCIEDPEKTYSDIHNKNFPKYSYRRENCFEFCLHENFKIKCNCSLSEDKDSGLEKCVRYSNCFREFIATFNHMKNCNSSCPTECNDTNFKITHASEFNIMFPGLMYSEPKNISNFDKNRTRQIYLYYQQLRYTEIIQIPKITITNLVSNIGGTLSLFLGLSLLSLIEFLEFMELFTNLSFLLNGLKKRVTKKNS